MNKRAFGVARLKEIWRNNKPHLQWAYRIGCGYKRYILFFLFINLCSMLISLASSVAGKYLVDAATGFQTDIYVKYIVIMLLTSIAAIGLSVVSNIFSGYVSERFSFSVKAEMYDRVQRSSWYKLSHFHTGDLLSRLTADIDNIASNIINLLPNIIVTSLQLMIVLGILIAVDPVLALIGLVIGPLGMISAVLCQKKFTAYQQKLRETQSEYYSFFQETLANIGVIKTFQLEDENNTRFHQIRQKRMPLVIESAKLNSLMSSLMRLVYSIGYVVAFSWCAYRLSTATTYVDASGMVVATYTYGTMTLFLTLVSQLQGSIRALGHVVPTIFSMLVSIKRVREITEIEDEEYSETGSMPKTVALQADHVTFSYEEKIVLNNLSFSIPAGTHVAIVGASGAGKTTFIRLLLSLVKADSGELFFLNENGETEIVGPSSRRFISYVPQGNSLLSGSIRTNLLTGKSDATDEEMWNVLKIVEAEQFVKAHPMGLDCVLSERAGGLSEGQAQRIAIARALLRNKPVLILDEATSALDEDTEACIFERITQNCDCTCFIITHRKSMLKYCDMILEIDKNGSATIKENL